MSHTLLSPTRYASQDTSDDLLLLADFFSILLCSPAVKARISPLFQQRNAADQLRDGRLIDPTAGSLDEFCIELAMIDTSLSRHTTDQSPVLVSQFVLLVMERHCRLCGALAPAG